MLRSAGMGRGGGFYKNDRMWEHPLVLEMGHSHVWYIGGGTAISVEY